MARHHPHQNLYEVLGVPANASEQEITHAYRRLARRYHPDANPGDAAAEYRFKEISEAYAILSTERGRADYDRKWMAAEGSRARTSTPRMNSTIASGTPSNDSGGPWRVK